MEEIENGNGKLKWKTEVVSGNGKAEIGKCSSILVALMESLCMRDFVWGYNMSIARFFS